MTHYTFTESNLFYRLFQGSVVGMAVFYPLDTLRSRIQGNSINTNTLLLINYKTDITIMSRKM